MAKSECGLNEAAPTDSTTGVPNGKACVQTFAKKPGSAVHLYNIDGTVPTFYEVCGRSAISGIHNQESMGTNFATFMKDIRIMDKDAYWLDTRMTESCVHTKRSATRSSPSHDVRLGPAWRPQRSDSSREIARSADSRARRHCTARRTARPQLSRLARGRIIAITLDMPPRPALGAWADADLHQAPGRDA
ncbi:hypothetical protein [Streptomyces sp. NPDC048473]|uniref:hypothetical protein n=1 Tax=unclassified Streptomyces TaxID=2593676 RepID=UPI00371104FA